MRRRRCALRRPQCTAGLCSNIVMHCFALLIAIALLLLTKLAIGRFIAICTLKKKKLSVTDSVADAVIVHLQKTMTAL